MGIGARTKRVLGVAAAGTALLSLTACNGSFYGVGTMDSASGRGVASMSFSVICDPNTQEVAGNMTFNDSGAGTSVRAQATGYPVFDSPALVEQPEFPGEFYGAYCDNDPEEGHYIGSFSGTVNRTFQSGRMTLDVDLDSEDCSGKPYVQLSLEGARTSYYNDGCFAAGRIQPIYIPQQPQSSVDGRSFYSR